MLSVIFVAAEDFEDLEGVTGLSSQEFWSGCKYKQSLSAKNAIIQISRIEEKWKFKFIVCLLIFDMMKYLIIFWP